MLQNRVDPFGEIIKTSARGTMMGNRGLLHNDKKEIFRPFKLKAWIACKLEFKNRKRDVMTPNLYTELFFLDEATAFSAGHRPCFECRREDYNRFKACWIKGNPEYGFNEKTSIKEIDEIMHNERMAADFTKLVYTEKLKDVPDGTFVVIDNEPHLFYNNLLYKWTAFGYTEKKRLPAVESVNVLTPKSVVNAFKAGYIPQVLK